MAKFSVQFFDKVVRCSCGHFEEVGSPCLHALFALKHSCEMTSMIDCFHDSWKTSTFLDGYSEKAEINLLSILLKDSLTRGVCDAPSISKKRGRPKKKRISSKQATEEIDNRQTRKCGICNQFGYNRRTCTTKGGVLNV